MKRKRELFMQNQQKQQSLTKKATKKPYFWHKVLTFVVICGTMEALATIFASGSASAVDYSGFKAGNIMSDYVMSDKSSMSADEIQRFLDSKVSCDQWGIKRSELGGGTRAQYAANYGVALPMNCINIYEENGKKASQIIYDVAQQYSINPKVLIVLLQKEQGLITDEWPFPGQYKTATGFGCPDTAPCQEQYFGFTNQLKKAAALFREVLDGGWTNYPVGNNLVRYSPDASCGGSTVYIENRATSALYRYTPYQPNSGALAAGTGTAPCGAYGNRNFYYYFTAWFGSTQEAKVTFESFADPRLMTLKKDVAKYSPSFGFPTSDIFKAGLTRKFVSKTTLPDGRLCFRTEADHSSDTPLCFLADDLVEADISPEKLTSGNIVRASKDLFAMDLRRMKNVGDKVFAYRQIKITAQVVLNGELYFVINNEIGVSANDAIQSVEFEEVEPKAFILTEKNAKYDIAGKEYVGDVLPEGLYRIFDSRVNVDGVWYYRTEAETSNDSSLTLSENVLSDNFLSDFVEPRYLRTDSNTKVLDTSKNAYVDEELENGADLLFTRKMVTDITWYYQAKDHEGTNLVIDKTDLAETGFLPFSQPREMCLAHDTQKVNPNNMARDGYFPAGLCRKFISKRQIDDKWYFRTEIDTDEGNDLTFSAEALHDK